MDVHGGGRAAGDCRDGSVFDKQAEAIPLLRKCRIKRGARCKIALNILARCEIAFFKITPNILAGEDTNFCVFSRYRSRLERGLLQKTHFAIDLFSTFRKVCAAKVTACNRPRLIPADGAEVLTGRAQQAAHSLVHPEAGSRSPGIPKFGKNAGQTHPPGWRPGPSYVRPGPAPTPTGPWRPGQSPAAGALPSEAVG